MDRAPLKIKTDAFSAPSPFQPFEKNRYTCGMAQTGVAQFVPRDVRTEQNVEMGIFTAVKCFYLLTHVTFTFGGVRGGRSQLNNLR